VTAATNAPPSTTTQGGGKTAAPDGKQIFTANCASCHTLKAAGSTGTVGPNLDAAKPSESLAETQVTNGGGVMPAFKGTLTPAEIKAVATFVSSNAGK
jgi:mono/diheme cytochrome c family protein